MIETELKINLQAEGFDALKADPELAALRLGRPRTQLLVSVYYDTPEHDLAAAGVALRLRKAGRRWVQTIKRRSGPDAEAGLFSTRESERPAPGGRLVLEGTDEDGALAAVREASRGKTLAPVFETRITRTSGVLAAPGGGEVELALDAGEIRAGDARLAVREAELELKAGEVSAVYAVARRLFRTGPVRFAETNKSARGYRLARGEDEATPAPRSAGAADLQAGTTAEAAAISVLRDCLGQIAGNMVVLADDEAVEGPHQLRVGLRRLRTALSVFAPVLGKEATAPLREAAKGLGKLVGPLRDADVLKDEVVAAAAARGLDAAALAALDAALAARRKAIRSEVREALAAPGAVGFLFDLGAFVEGRGWLAPSDHGQTERLATPVDEMAPERLAARHKKVMKAGRKIRKLDAEGLHALRKELKKLRYTVEIFAALYPGKRTATYLQALKDLQDSFGSLNDAAMARTSLSGPDAPAARSPDAQRAVGWTLGTLAVQVGDDRPKLFQSWDHLASAKPFWH